MKATDQLASTAALVLVLSVAMSACVAAPGVATSRLVTQESFQICPANLAQGPQTIGTRAAWQSLVQATGSGSPLAQWQPDFGKHLVWVYAMGQQRSGGYAVRVQDAKASQAANTLEISLVEQRPAAGGLTSAQLTSPCVVALLDAQGATSVAWVPVKP